MHLTAEDEQTLKNMSAGIGERHKANKGDQSKRPGLPVLQGHDEGEDGQGHVFDHDAQTAQKKAEGRSVTLQRKDPQHQQGRLDHIQVRFAGHINQDQGVGCIQKQALRRQSAIFQHDGQCHGQQQIKADHGALENSHAGGQGGQQAEEQQRQGRIGGG